MKWLSMCAGDVYYPLNMQAKQVTGTNEPSAESYAAADALLAEVAASFEAFELQAA